MFGVARVNNLARYQAATGRTAAGVATNGNAKVSTTTPKFGTGSMLLDGTGDYLMISPTTSGGSGPWTIEFWVKFSTAPATRANSGWQMAWAAEGSQSYILLWSNYVQFGINGGFGSFALGSTMTTGTWYHIAVVCNSNDYKVYFNGTDRGAAIDDGGYAGRTGVFNCTPSGTNTYRFGCYVDGTRGVIGNMDEMRISNNARYTANFTPSASAFTNDANTVLLIHADGANNSTTFTDDNA